MNSLLSELLGTIWEKHARVIRPELAQEVGRIVVRFAAGNIDVNSGTPVYDQWDAQRRFLERLVRETVKEFESRLEPGDDTARFLAVEAANAASMLAQNEVQRLQPPRVLSSDMKERWEQHKQRLALHLGTVTATEFRVIASTPRLRRAVKVAVALPPGTQIAFPDTNVLLRAQPLNQIDWKGLLGAEQVDLVVARVVVDEVDKKKYDVKASMQDRARKANAQLQAIREAGGEIREGVRLALTFDELDAAELRTKGMVWDHGDDRLLGAALKYRAGDQTQIVIVSMDNGLLNRATALGFKALKLPDKYVPGPGPDPTELENRKLRAQIEDLQSKLPKLDLVFATGARDLAVDIPIQQPNDIALLYVREWSQALGVVLAANPVLDFPENVGAVVGADANETASFWAFAQEQESAEHAVARSIIVTFRLMNESPYPAQGVRLSVTLPVTIEAFNRRIEFPKEPAFKKPPRGQTDIIAQMPRFRNRPIRMAAPDSSSTPGVEGPFYVDDNPRVIGYRVHGTVADRDKVTLPEVVLLFSEGELPEEAQLDYSIVATGVQKPFEGKLSIRIRQFQPPTARATS